MFFLFDIHLYTDIGEIFDYFNKVTDSKNFTVELHASHSA